MATKRLLQPSTCSPGILLQMFREDVTCQCFDAVGSNMMYSRDPLKPTKPTHQRSQFFRRNFHRFFLNAIFPRRRPGPGTRDVFRRFFVWLGERFGDLDVPNFTASLVP